MTQLSRIVLTGGGTGGHIYPALALCRYLQKQYPNLEVLYIGTEKGLESTIVPKAGLSFETINIQGIKRSLSLENLKTLWLLFNSTSKARQILKDFKPDIVIGTGGYVAAPVIYAAHKLGIPTIIHEQNSVVGLTNKWLSRYSDRIAVAFEDAFSDFKKYADKTILVGNPRGQEVIEEPVDRNILKDQFDLDPDKATVLIFGGSRGAPSINQAAFDAMNYWQDVPYQVIIATGTEHYDTFMQQAQLSYEDLPQNIKIVPYIDQMPTVFQAVDLVVCRSGATTLTELTALGIASILIPSPYVTNNHQEHNAKALADRGAAEMIYQAELTGETLSQKVEQLMINEEQRTNMAHLAYELGIRDANTRLDQQIQLLMKDDQ